MILLTLEYLCCICRRFLTRTFSFLVLPTPPTGMTDCPQTNLFGMSFRPTQPSIRTLGGENGFPGSSVNIRCSEENGITPCGNANMDW